MDPLNKNVEIYLVHMILAHALLIGLEEVLAKYLVDPLVVG